jgi:hypothetical protein
MYSDAKCENRSTLLIARTDLSEHHKEQYIQTGEHPQTAQLRSVSQEPLVAVDRPHTIYIELMLQHQISQVGKPLGGVDLLHVD